MGFLTRHRRTTTLDVTRFADPDGTEYWVRLRPLTGDEWEVADAAQTEMTTQMSQSTGKKAREEIRRRKARRAAGLPVTEEDEDEGEMQTLVRVDLRAYRAAVLNFAIVDWNLNDEYDRPLPLDPEDRAAREASIRLLPKGARTLIVDWAEAQEAEPSAEKEADFPGGLPVGGEDGALGASADPGAVAARDMVVAHWADGGAGVGDLHPARTD